MGQRLVLNQLTYQNLDRNYTKYMRELFPSLDTDYTRAKSLEKKGDFHDGSRNEPTSLPEGTFPNIMRGAGVQVKPSTPEG